MSGKASLLNIVQEEELRRQQKEEVKANFSEMKKEQEQYQQQFVEVVQVLQDKIQELKKKGEERIVPLLGGTYWDSRRSYWESNFQDYKGPRVA